MTTARSIPFVSDGHDYTLEHTKGPVEQFIVRDTNRTIVGGIFLNHNSESAYAELGGETEAANYFEFSNMVKLDVATWIAQVSIP